MSATAVAENLPSGTAVGTLTTTDPNAGNTFTYSLVSGTGSDNNGSFTISGSTLQTAASFDYETKNSYSIRVRSTDQGGLYTEKVFTISVTNVNEPPVILGTSRTPTAPSPADAVWVTSTVTDDGSVAGVKLTYSTGSGTPTTTTVFTETMTSTAVKPWTGTGARECLDRDGQLLRAADRVQLRHRQRLRHGVQGRRDAQRAHRRHDGHDQHHQRRRHVRVRGVLGPDADAGSERRLDLPARFRQRLRDAAERS